MKANEVVLYVTLGFMLLCFVAWLWQSIVKRRKLEDEIEQQKSEPQDGDDSAPRK